MGCRVLNEQRRISHLYVMIVDLEKIEAIADRVVSGEGLTLIDVELKGGRSNPLLRIYIDKPGGVSHEDCALVSEQIGAILDVEDPFPGSYVLEVSSPGLDRTLVKPREFKYFTGRRARVALREPLEEQKVFEGRLAGYEESRVKLALDDGRTVELDLSNISKARLLPEL
ncbi:MAG TPA: ribosome maturation factor RimP [Terriglobia bacterium]|nr:ribosome maturation factor RimP [Terriglobia bacterium]